MGTPTPVGEVEVARAVDDGQLGGLARRDAAVQPSDRADVAVAAWSASAGVSPISRTASAMTRGIDEE